MLLHTNPSTQQWSRPFIIKCDFGNMIDISLCEYKAGISTFRICNLKKKMQSLKIFDTDCRLETAHSFIMVLSFTIGCI